LVIDWTTIGASPPTATARSPQRTTIDLDRRRGAGPTIV
jgi:hypothetical protein